MSSRRGIALGLSFICALMAGDAGAARDLIVADGPGGTATYALLERSYGIEVPDCGHAVPHWTEVMDDELGKFVFVAHAHVDQDDDRCMNTDRQRTELRGRSTGVQGPEGSTRYYRWKFRLPPGFQSSGAFTHIFQIKAYGNGHGSGAPVMTLTPRNNSTMAIDGRIGVRGSTTLSRFIGTWVVVDLMIVHANAGRLAMTIKNLKTGEMLFNYSGTADMYDDGAGYGAPKHGIYRSLNQRSALRDEQVRFADFCVSTTSAAECDDGATPPPPPPSDAGGTPPPDAQAPARDGGADTARAPDATQARDMGAAGGTGGGGGGGGSGGTGGGSGGGGGNGGAGAGGGTGGGSGDATGGSPGAGGEAPPPPPRQPRGTAGGCSCDLSTPRSRGPGVGAGLLLAVVALSFQRRRRGR